MADGIDMALEQVTQQLQELKQRLSELRKQGKDPLLVELQLTNLPSKIQYASITRSYKDLQKVTITLQNARAEADEVANKDKLDLNTSVGDYMRKFSTELHEKEALPDFSQNEIIIKARGLVRNAYQHIEAGNNKAAFDNYRQLRAMYNYLPRELKSQIYHDSLAIYQRIQELKKMQQSSAVDQAQTPEALGKKPGLFHRIKIRLFGSTS